MGNTNPILEISFVLILCHTLKLYNSNFICGKSGYICYIALKLINKTLLASLHEPFWYNLLCI